MLKHDGFQSIAEIDSRLVALEQEKKQLLALREQLQQPSPNTSDSTLYSPEQKIAIFGRLFRGRNDIFANRWQNKQGRSGYSVACNNEWVQGICHKPRIKCQDCNYRQFTELNDQIIYRHLAGQQYAGRIHRESDGKDRVTIYDYVDCSLPMLQRMFNKREKNYKAMGYQISFNGGVPEQGQLSTEFLLVSDKKGSEAPA